jgi:hypothetical protein
MSIVLPLSPHAWDSTDPRFSVDAVDMKILAPIATCFFTATLGLSFRQQSDVPGNKDPLIFT